MSQRDGPQKIASLLRRRGLVAAGDVVRELGITRATLARWLANLPSPWVAVGKTRGLKYGLLHPVADMESEIPLFRVNAAGQLSPVGKLLVLHGGYYVVEPGAQSFQALPLEISDMAPQGFMGRGFAREFSSELRLPPRLQDWSDEHVLKAIAKRGEDLAGNVIVGSESAERWQKLTYQDAKRASFKTLADLALRDQPVGSSAGGEQPKFSVVLNGVHTLVKFAGPLNSPAQKRWRDLLLCEFIAGEVLKSGGFQTCATHFSQSGDYAFLEIQRFDRAGVRGRKSVVTLAAVDDAFFGGRDSWTLASKRLWRGGFLSESDTHKIRLLDAFCRLIGDSDRHFYNLSLFPRVKSDATFLLKSFELAPTFDKLPMTFAPVDGRLVERDFTRPLPTADVIEVWGDATRLATSFWQRVAGEKAISPGFRKIAQKCLRELQAF